MAPRRVARDTLVDGRLAVLDLQSMRPHDDAAHAGRAMAARLLPEAIDVPVDGALEVLVRTGLIDSDQRQAVAERAKAIGVDFLHKRARRCSHKSIFAVRSAAQILTAAVRSRTTVLSTLITSTCR